jgi:AbiV family abortive infection protein
MHRAYRNARDLAEDAQLLLKQRPARAISLAVLALEETAKIFLLAESIPTAAAGPVSWSEIERKRGLRSHKEKQGAFSGYGKSILSESYAAAGKRLYKTEMPEGIAPLLDWLKQMGCYVDVVKGRFISPEEIGVENRGWARWLIAAATDRLDSIEHFHETEARSIEVAKGIEKLSQLGTAEDLLEAVQKALKNSRGQKSDNASQISTAVGRVTIRPIRKPVRHRRLER